MGILDDAIREHLDLKRKHGAPGDDIERLEKEAFGPPTRPGDSDFEEPAEAASGEALAEETGEEWSPERPPPEAEAEGEPTAADRARSDYSHLDDTVDHPAVPEPASEEDQPSEGPEPAEPPEAEIFDAEADVDNDDEAYVELASEEGFDLDLELEDPSGRPPDPVSRPGFEPDDDQEDVLEDEEEDVLEETPEFLQDTPEGERLWFEQGKPKDFDFDD